MKKKLVTIIVLMLVTTISVNGLKINQKENTLMMETEYRVMDTSIGDLFPESEEQYCSLVEGVV